MTLSTEWRISQVFDGFRENLRIVFGMSKHHIAKAAKNPPEYLGLVVMIARPRSSFPARICGSTNGAPFSLEDKECVPLFGRDPVKSESPICLPRLSRSLCALFKICFESIRVFSLISCKANFGCIASSFIIRANLIAMGISVLLLVCFNPFPALLVGVRSGVFRGLTVLVSTGRGRHARNSLRVGYWPGATNTGRPHCNIWCCQ